MIYYISTTKQPNLIKTLIEKFGKSSPWSPCYMLCNTQVIYLQGFWYRPDIVCGKNNMYSMDASFWSIADLDELNKLNSKSNCVFLKPETPIEILYKIIEIENSMYKVSYDINDEKTFVPIRKENYQDNKLLMEIINLWLLEKQTIKEFKLTI